MKTMPPPRRATQAVARLRSLSGLSQLAFATLCGIPSGTLARVEARAKNLPDVAARRISAAAGCQLASLMEGRLVALDGTGYTEETFRAWTSHALSEEQEEELRDDLSFRLGILLRAFATAKRSRYAAARLRQLLMDVADESGLTPKDLAQAARLDAEIDPVDMSVEEAAHHPELRECRGFPELMQGFPPEARIVGVVERFRTWPEVGAPQDEAVPLAAKAFCHFWRLRLPDGTAKNLPVHHLEVSGYGSFADNLEEGEELTSGDVERMTGTPTKPSPRRRGGKPKTME